MTDEVLTRRTPPRAETTSGDRDGPHRGSNRADGREDSSAPEVSEARRGPSNGPAHIENLSHTKFQLAPPRNFQYPAVLLLLAEEPRHGYRLVDALLRLGFGPVDRGSVYRTLNDLEADGLLRSWTAEPTAGSTRHVYELTILGYEVLESWMSVVDDECDALDKMVTRYQKLDGQPRGEPDD